MQILLDHKDYILQTTYNTTAIYACRIKLHLFENIPINVQNTTQTFLTANRFDLFQYTVSQVLQFNTGFA